jgi:hypothetical protein
MKIALLCDGPVPHSRMNYRGEAFLRLLPGPGHTVYLIAMGVGGANELRHDITLVSHSCGRYTQIAGIRNIPVRLWQIFRMFVATKRVLRHDVDLIRTISIVPTIVALMAGWTEVSNLQSASLFRTDCPAAGPGSSPPRRRKQVMERSRQQAGCCSMLATSQQWTALMC